MHLGKANAPLDGLASIGYPNGWYQLLAVSCQTHCRQLMWQYFLENGCMVEFPLRFNIVQPCILAVVPESSGTLKGSVETWQPNWPTGLKITGGAARVHM